MRRYPYKVKRVQISGFIQGNFAMKSTLDLDYNNLKPELIEPV